MWLLRAFALIFLSFEKPKIIRRLRILTDIKVTVKQAFSTVDEIKFEAALTAYAIESQYKQKEYAN